jgi:hypothetical protein
MCFMSVYVGINRVSRSAKMDYPKEGRMERRNAGWGEWSKEIW